MAAGGAEIVGDREGRRSTFDAESVPFTQVDDRTGCRRQGRRAGTTGSPTSGVKRRSHERARQERVEHALRDALTEMIARRRQDPRVHAPTLLTVAQGRAQRRQAVARCLRLDRRRRRDRRRRDRRPQEGRGLPARADRPRARPAARTRAAVHPRPVDRRGEKLAAILREDEEKARAAGASRGKRCRRSPPRTSRNERPAAAHDRAGRDCPTCRRGARARVRGPARRRADPAHQPPPPRRRRHRLDGRARVAASRAGQGPR